MWQYLVYKIKDISSLSYYEYITIVGHYNRLLYQENVDPQLLARGFTKEQIEQMMKHRKSSPRELISCNLHFKRSLDDFDYPYFDYLFTLFNQYHKHGTMPFLGNHAGQPAKILEIFELFEQLDNERQEKQRKEEERKRAKEGRRKRK